MKKIVNLLNKHKSTQLINGGSEKEPEGGRVREEERERDGCTHGENVLMTWHEEQMHYLKPLRIVGIQIAWCFAAIQQPVAQTLHPSMHTTALIICCQRCWLNMEPFSTISFQNTLYLFNLQFYTLMEKRYCISAWYEKCHLLQRRHWPHLLFDPLSTYCDLLATLYSHFPGWKSVSYF